MRNSNTNHTNVTLNLIQSLFKFNKLVYGNTCQGLRHWKLLFNLKNNFSKPVRNDMDNKRRSALLCRQLNWLDCFAFARNDEIVEFEDNKILKQVQNDAKDKNGNELINLSTYRLIDFKKKIAFTLAETLITLGIIGVVAALTIPGLMTNYKKHKIETKLTKAVSTLNQAIKMSESENGEMETWDKNLPYDEFINKYLRPYMKVEQICNSKNPCGLKGSIWKYLNGTENGTYCSPYNFNRSGFISTDGVFYVFAYKNTGETGVEDNDKIIIIDINGAEKPNVMGQDVFFLKRIEAEDSILPWGADKGMTTITKSCSKNGSGHYCAALIRANGWKIPNNYPL